MKANATPRTLTMSELLNKEDLTVVEAAQLLRVSEPTVYRLVDSGQLDYWRKTAGKGTMIYTSSLKQYIIKVQGRKLPNGHSKK